MDKYITINRRHLLWRAANQTDLGGGVGGEGECSLSLNSIVHTQTYLIDLEQGQDSRLKMRTFLKPASLGYGGNKQH